MADLICQLLTECDRRFAIQNSFISTLYSPTALPPAAQNPPSNLLPFRVVARI